MNTLIRTILATLIVLTTGAVYAQDTTTLPPFFGIKVSVHSFGNTSIWLDNEPACSGVAEETSLEGDTLEISKQYNCSTFIYEPVVISPAGKVFLTAIVSAAADVVHDEISDRVDNSIARNLLSSTFVGVENGIYRDIHGRHFQRRDVLIPIEGLDEDKYTVSFDATFTNAEFVRGTTSVSGSKVYDNQLLPNKAAANEMVASMVAMLTEAHGEPTTAQASDMSSDHEWVLRGQSNVGFEYVFTVRVIHEIRLDNTGNVSIEYSMDYL